MPVPKRKTSRSRRDMRSASKFIRPQAFGSCSYCAAPLLPHIVCDTCGYYKGKKILVTKLDRALRRGELRRKSGEASQNLSSQDVSASDSSSAQ